MFKVKEDHKWNCWALAKTLDGDRPYPWSHVVNVYYETERTVISITCADHRCGAEIEIPVEDLVGEMPVGDSSY